VIPLQVLVAATEMEPWLRVGELAERVAASAEQLASRGVPTIVVLPLTDAVRERAPDLEEVAARVPCTFAGACRPFRLLRAPTTAHPLLEVHFVEHPSLFELGDGPYGDDRGPEGLGRYRWLYFSRALLRVPQALDRHVTIFHIHDWPVALAPLLARAAHRDEPRIREACFVLSIHEIEHQGRFSPEEIAALEVAPWLLHQGRLIHDGEVNLLAAGISTADAICAPSPGVARGWSRGRAPAPLGPLLAERAEALHGVLPGLDVVEWDPGTDPALPAPFEIEDLGGRARCREALREEVGLAEAEGPTLAFCGPLHSRAGADLLAQAAAEVLEEFPDVAVLVCGEGDPKLEARFSVIEAGSEGRLRFRAPPRAGLFRRLLAGTDLFVLPTRHEPSGVLAMRALRYGAVPVALAEGALSDLVVSARPETIERSAANGFLFPEATPWALRGALRLACQLWWHAHQAFETLVRTGMGLPCSWSHRGEEWLRIYESARRNAGVGAHLERLLRDLPAEPIEAELPVLAPLPASWPRAHLRLVPVDPTTLYVSWNLPDAGVDGGPAGAFEAELVLQDEEAGIEEWHRVGPHGARFLRELGPGRRYSARLQGGPAPALVHAPVELPPEGNPS
jgi:starch synthase